jgi:hypothetical protein
MSNGLMFIGGWTLSVDMDVVRFGGGVRIMKPSGVGGDGPVFCRENPKLTQIWSCLPGGRISIAVDTDP